MTAEQAILGCMLNDGMVAKMAAGKLRDSDFTDPVNKLIFTAIVKDIDDGIEPDIITVARRCKSKEEYIVELSASIVTSFNHMAYIQAVLEDSAIREFHAMAPDILQEYESQSIIKKVEGVVKEVQSRTVDLIDYSVGETIARTMQMYSEREAGKVPGIDTPLSNLTYYTGGWQPGDLIIIAARPSIGKTAFALACGQEAIKTNKSVLIFSLEMSRERLMDRLLIGYSECDPMRYKTGKLNPVEKQNIRRVSEQLKECNLFIVDRGAMGLSDIEAFATERRRENKCDLIIIDYLQLMKTKHERNKTRDGELSEVSRGLKLMAKELSVPVIALSQLNREVEKRADKKPMLADLRESGAIEQDADLVLLLYRAAFYGIETIEIGNNTESSAGIGELIIAKHRNGETGTEYFRHNGSLTRIYSYNTAGL